MRDASVVAHATAPQSAAIHATIHATAAAAAADEVILRRKMFLHRDIV